MVESEGEEAHSDGETEALGVGRAGSSMQQATQEEEEEKEEEEYKPFDCMYAMLERFTKVSSLYSFFAAESLLPEWHAFSLHSQLLRALHYKGFNAPTPIQVAALPVALKGKDVIGVAQTVSGIDIYIVLTLIALH